MGASYIVTGSINQSCVESGTSEHVKGLLAKADFADVVNAPSADMFEMGVKVQLLKKGSMFPFKAQKLYDLYRVNNRIEDIPPSEKGWLEKQIFKKSVDDVWSDTVEFFRKTDPQQIERALKDPKKKLALLFKWYLGQSSNWAINGEKGREMDYQIWCGPAMGLFNDWVSGSYLEKPENRKVVHVVKHMMEGAAYLTHVYFQKTMGVNGGEF
jgi:PfaD family protein